MSLVQTLLEIIDACHKEASARAEKVVELSSEIFPTGYEQFAFKQAVQKAKKEAALETAVEESVLLNPELLRDLRRRLLED